jgi:ParB family chromosome partitioning protein
MGTGLMGRKNIFEAAVENSAVNEAASGPLRRPGAPSVSTLGSSLRDMSENGIQNLDPMLIDESGHKDRLEIDSAEIKRLAESIRDHGQQVPILVRPGRESMNRFTIVYGRRRLAAIKLLGDGTRIKAIVRHLDDDAAIVAQGQENNLRIDPTYIEKALFARELRDGGYDSQVIQDALGIDRTAISKMSTVVENVPREVILHIGAAQDVGRRAWTELAMLVRDEGVDLIPLLPREKPAGSTGAQRFEDILVKARNLSNAASQRKIAAPQKDTVTAGTVGTGASREGGDIRRFSLEGKHLGTMRKTGRSLSLNVSLRHQPDFGQWLEENADDVVGMLRNLWLESREEG